MTAKFKFDENLPTEAAALFVEAGYDALTVADQRMGGQPDPGIAAACRQEGRAIVTLDLDFGDIRTYPPSDYAGIIVLRFARQNKLRVLAVLRRLLSVMGQQPLVGKLWIVDETTIRIRA